MVVALVPGQQRSLDKLKAMRTELANEVAAVINEFGPKLYEEFDEVWLPPFLCFPMSHTSFHHSVANPSTLGQRTSFGWK